MLSMWMCGACICLRGHSCVSYTRRVRLVRISGLRTSLQIVSAFLSFPYLSLLLWFALHCWSSNERGSHALGSNALSPLQFLSSLNEGSETNQERKKRKRLFPSLSCLMIGSLDVKRTKCGRDKATPTYKSPGLISLSGASVCLDTRRQQENKTDKQNGRDERPRLHQQKWKVQMPPHFSVRPTYRKLLQISFLSRVFKKNNQQHSSFFSCLLLLLTKKETWGVLES